MKSATEKDIQNVEAWAEVVEDLLYLVPTDKRAAVLALATEKERQEQKKRDESGGLIIMNAAELANATFPHWNVIMRLKALLIQVLVRNITNNHSKEDAAAILFAHQRYGNGSGYLLDYLEDLPGLPKTTSAARL
jgi:hypothetical protein